MAAANTASKVLYRIFVGNLPWTASESELKQCFSEFGYITKAKVIFNRDTGMSKRYGFIEVNDKNIYATILKSHGLKLDGKLLYVRETVD